MSLTLKSESVGTTSSDKSQFELDRVHKVALLKPDSYLTPPDAD